MTQIVVPLASYEATLEAGVTGLVGTLKLGTYDGDTPTQPLSALTINEIGTSGVYIATRTAPGTAGQYVLVWSLDGTLDPEQVITEDLTVTSAETAAIGGTSNLYVSRAEIKAAGALTGETFADDDIDVVIAAASRACDDYRRDISPFYPSTQTRYYTPGQYADHIAIKSLNALTSVTVDTDGTYLYADTWTEATEFWLEPTNAAADGIPYHTLRLIEQDGTRFPRYQRAVKITGSFGWAETPIQVKQAAKEYAIFMLHKTRNAPLAIVVAESMNAARTGGLDRNVASLLNQLPRRRASFHSLQLG